MMRCGHQARLPQPELSRWSRITGFAPRRIKINQPPNRSCPTSPIRVTPRRCAWASTRATAP